MIAHDQNLNVQVHEEGSFMDSIEKLEESQSHIASLINQLDEQHRKEDDEEMDYLIDSMGNILDHYAENHYELQLEMKAVLDSSRAGLLTHDRLSEMVQGEQTRTNFLVNIVGSLKVLLDRLFDNFNNIMEENDLMSSEGAMKALNSMNMVMKSMDSITKVVVAPSKQLDRTVRKIDSELLIHLNNSIYLTLDSKAPGSLKQQDSSRQMQNKRGSKQRNPFASMSPVSSDARPVVKGALTGASPRKSHVTHFQLDNITKEEVPVSLSSPVNPSRRDSMNLLRKSFMGIVDEGSDHSDDSDSDDNTDVREAKRSRRAAKKVTKAGKKSSKKGKKGKKKHGKKGSRRKKGRGGGGGGKFSSDDGSDSDSDYSYSEDDSEDEENETDEDFGSNDHQIIGTKKTLHTKKRPVKKKRGENAQSGGKSMARRKSGSSVGSLDSSGKGAMSSPPPAAVVVNDDDDDSVGRKLRSRRRINRRSVEVNNSLLGDAGAGDGSRGKGGVDTNGEGAADPISGAPFEDSTMAHASAADKKYYKKLIHRLMLKENEVDRKLKRLDNEINRRAREILYGTPGAATATNEAGAGDGEEDDGSVRALTLQEIEAFRAAHPNQAADMIADYAGADPLLGGRKYMMRQGKIVRVGADGQPQEFDDSVISDIDMSEKRKRLGTGLGASAGVDGMFALSGGEGEGRLNSGRAKTAMEVYEMLRNQAGRRALPPNSKWSTVKIYAPTLDKMCNRSTNMDDFHSYLADQGYAAGRGKKQGDVMYSDSFSEHGLDDQQDEGGAAIARGAEGDHSVDMISHENTTLSGSLPVLGRPPPGTIGGASRASDKVKLRRKIAAANAANSTFGGKNGPGGNNAIEKGKKYELPMFDSQGGILVTRTYREQPKDKHFMEILYESPNPLYSIYEEYEELLPEAIKARLLALAINTSRIDKVIPESSSVHQMLWMLLENVLLVESECDVLLNNVDLCETMVKNLVALKDSAEAVDPETLQLSVQDLFTKLGESEALKLLVDIKLFEYRSVFDTITAQGMHTLQTLLQESAEFAQCYTHFLASQGKSVEFYQRLAGCKDRCERYQLGKLSPHANALILSLSRTPLLSSPAMDLALNSRGGAATATAFGVGNRGSFQPVLGNESPDRFSADSAKDFVASGRKPPIVKRGGARGGAGKAAAAGCGLIKREGQGNRGAVDGGGGVIESETAGSGTLVGVSLSSAASVDLSGVGTAAGTGTGTLSVGGGNCVGTANTGGGGKETQGGVRKGGTEVVRVKTPVLSVGVAASPKFADLHNPNNNSNGTPMNQGTVGQGQVGEMEKALLTSAAIEIERLQKETAYLRTELERFDEDYRDLEVEAFQHIQGRDSTPGALLFFSLLHEPQFVQALQQLVLQMTHLRAFAVGNQHLDFVTLKKRVQVCVVSMPTVQKLLDRYAGLHKRWTISRMNWFQDKNKTGGSADSYVLCPLCYHDLLDSPHADVRATTVKQVMRGGPADRLPNVHMSAQQQQGEGKKGGKAGGGGRGSSSADSKMLKSASMPVVLINSRQGRRHEHQLLQHELQQHDRQSQGQNQGQRQGVVFSDSMPTLTGTGLGSRVGSPHHSGGPGSPTFVAGAPPYTAVRASSVRHHHG